MSRISPGTILLLFIAVLAGLLGAYVIRQRLQPKPVAANASPDSVTVPMAGADLTAGREITMGDIVLARLTRQQMRERGVEGPFMTNTRQIMGRILKADLPRGSTFDPSLFYPEGFGHGIEHRLQSGFRAVTVTVEADDALLGFAGAGSWVDVMFRSHADQVRRSAPRYPETTVTLMENVEILALGKETTPGAKPAAMSGRRQIEMAVTLAVTPEQAAALGVVKGRGVLSLVLRRPDDAATAQAPAPKTLGDVLNQPQSHRHIDVYRGRRMQRVFFERHGAATSTSRVSRRLDIVDPVPAAPATAAVADTSE
jgi:Flp pilus assembly protein CpaB